MKKCKPAAPYQRPTLVLASNSERRIAGLNQMGLEFVVEPSLYEENNGHNMKPKDLVMHLAEGKAVEVAKRIYPEFPYIEGKHPYNGAIIIGADTLTFFDEKPLGKPADEAEAYKFLERLSKRPHWVHTGLALVDTTTGEIVTDSDSTLVHLKLSDREIRGYLKTGEPKGKAGAYAIQGRGGMYIPDVMGCYFNVVGLPLFKLRENLKKLSYEC